MKTKKVVSIILLILILVNSMQGMVSAFDIGSANLENLGRVQSSLQFFDTKQGAWSDILTTIVGYHHNGVLHYAYCLNVDRAGVEEAGNYSVNVGQILSDDAIYRAVVNGFPYKSAGELGVDNDQDAFVATKQAIYSVLYNRDVESYYNGRDDRGNRMKNAIRNIVNIARTGNQTPQRNDLVNVNKVGEFKKDVDNYYSQEYSVTSSVEISDYTVTGISNFVEGSFVADMNNTPKTTFGGGEHFKVLVPKEKILENFDGKVEVEGKVKCYPVFLGESPDAGKQNYALTYDAYTTANGEDILSVDAYKSKIKVIKIDAETKQTLEGVEFNFKYEDGQNIGNFTTDKNRRNYN